MARFIRPPRPAAQPDGDPASSSNISAASPGGRAGTRDVWIDILPVICTHCDLRPPDARQAAPLCPTPGTTPEDTNQSADTPAHLLARDELEACSLSLSSARIPHSLRREAGSWKLLVPPVHVQEATRQACRYLLENLDTDAPVENDPLDPFSPADPRGPEGAHNRHVLLAVLWGILALAVFHGVTQGEVGWMGLDRVGWNLLGRVDSGRVLAGAWWRTVTALTLHADGEHLLGNMLMGGLFLVLLGRAIGAGPAWLLAVVAGMLGNMLNSWAHGPGHLSVGASTAVFGVVGGLTGLRAVLGYGDGRAGGRLRAMALPVAAGFMFLALLGAGDERTDLGAHLFGLAAGLGLGGLAGLLLMQTRSRPPAWVAWCCAALAVFLPVWAWREALGAQLSLLW